MYASNILYRGLTVIALLALLLPMTSPPTMAAPPSANSARPALSIVADYAGWEEVGPGSASGGGISNNAGESYSPSIAIAPDGTPYVAWHDDSDGDNEIYVRRWNGSSWEEVGTGSASGGGISDNDRESYEPTLSIASDGTPYVAWADRNGTGQIYVRRWNGSSWEEVGPSSASGGGISNNSSWSWNPSMAIAPNGTPYVAWDDDGASSGENWIMEIYVRHWNGSSWEEVGPASASGRGISNNDDFSEYPSMAVAPNGTLYIAWENDWGAYPNQEIYVRRWNGNSWEEVGTNSATGGGISNDNSQSQTPSLAIAPDGTPYVAWADLGDVGWAIYVRRWNGSDWEEVGSGSASGGGISGNDAGARVPSIDIAPDGTPYVAWYTLDGICIRRWLGDSWEEVGTGSASGGGISGDNATSPSVAIASDGMPYVVWSNSIGSGSSEIYVRRWLGPPALQVTPSALTFLAKAGGANPSPRHISIGSSTDDAITWTATVSPTVGWLDINLISGTTPAVITATVSVPGSSTLLETAQIVVDGGEEVLDSPQIVPVKLIVTEEIYSVYLPLTLRSY